MVRAQMVGCGKTHSFSLNFLNIAVYMPKGRLYIAALK